MQPLVWTHIHDAGLLNAYPFPLRVMICLPCLLYAILFGSLCFIASLHICLHVHACVIVYACLCHQAWFYDLMRVHTHSWYTRSWVPFRNFVWWRMCRSYSNLMELWTLNPNLHLSFENTPFIWQHACLPPFGSLCSFVLSHAFLLVVFFHVCWFCVSLVVACAHLELGCLKRGRDFLGTSQKGQGRKQEYASLKGAMFSRLGGLASSSGLLYRSFSLFYLSLEPCTRVSFPCILLGPHS